MSIIMNNFRNIFLVIAISFFSVFSVSAQNSSGDIENFLKQRDAEIKSFIGQGTESFTAEQKDKLKELINGAIDFAEMGKLALEEHWTPLTEEQKAEFTEVFGDIVRAQSIADLGIYRAEVNFGDVEVAENTATVHSTTIYKNVEAAVIYHLVLVDENWKVADIVLDEVSTAGGYSRSFQRVIKRHGFERLMTSLRKRRDRIDS